MILKIREKLWTQMKRPTNLIQLYEETRLKGDHHLPSTYVTLRSGRSVEGKIAYLPERNSLVPGLRAKYVRENTANPKNWHLRTTRSRSLDIMRDQGRRLTTWVVVLCVWSFTLVSPIMICKLNYKKTSVLPEEPYYSGFTSTKDFCQLNYVKYCA